MEIPNDVPIIKVGKCPGEKRGNIRNQEGGGRVSRYRFMKRPPRPLVSGPLCTRCGRSDPCHVQTKAVGMSMFNAVGHLCGYMGVGGVGLWTS